MIDDTMSKSNRMFFLPEGAEYHPREYKPVPACPFMRPQYNGSQPECMEKGCAVYDCHNNQCGVLSAPGKSAMLNAARREVGRR